VLLWFSRFVHVFVAVASRSGSPNLDERWRDAALLSFGAYCPPSVGRFIIRSGRLIASKLIGTGTRPMHRPPRPSTLGPRQAFGHSASGRRKLKTTPKRHRRLLVEPLEPRTLLALVPQLLADINQTPATVQMLQNGPGDIVDVGGVAFFTGLGSVGTGYELFKSDGTAQGTMLVKDISPGVNRSNIANLTNISDTLLFTANDGTHGTELWKSDGTAAGTVLVKDIVVGAASSNPSSFLNVGGTLFFIASTSPFGAELWKSDGTTAGTVLVKDIVAGSVGSNPTSLTNVNGTLFFTVDDGTSGMELWKTDGTDAGTVLAADILSGPGSWNSGTAMARPLGWRSPASIAASPSPPDEPD